MTLQEYKQKRTRDGLPQNHFTLQELKELGMFDDSDMEKLINLAKNPENMIVAGASASGKTVLLRALLDYVEDKVYEASFCGELSADGIPHISPDNDDGRRWGEPIDGVYTIPDDAKLVVVQHFSTIRSKITPVIWYEANPRISLFERNQIQTHQCIKIKMDHFKIASIGYDWYKGE